MFRSIAHLALVALASLPQLAEADAKPPAAAKIAAAQAKVAGWMKPVEVDRVGIAAAFERRDASYLERAAVRLTKQQGLPGGDDLMREEFAPFLKCDTAVRDLAILASAMSRLVARPSDAARKIVVEEQSDFDRSSGECKRRLAMKPLDAWAAYQAE